MRWKEEKRIASSAVAECFFVLMAGGARREGYYTQQLTLSCPLYSRSRVARRCSSTLITPTYISRLVFSSSTYSANLQQDNSHTRKRKKSLRGCGVCSQHSTVQYCTGQYWAAALYCTGDYSYPIARHHSIGRYTLVLSRFLILIHFLLQYYSYNTIILI
jgi:hypothetical protein